MSHSPETALDQCLDWMRSGLEIESCLARYPQYADELRPLLELVPLVASAVPPAPSFAVRTTGKQHMLAALAQKRERQAGDHWLVRRLKQLFWLLAPGRRGSVRAVWQAAAMVLVVLLVASGGLAVVASTDSLPGDALYPVKLTRQQLQLAFTLNSAEKQVLEDQFSAQRRSDVRIVLEDGRRVTVEFEGVLLEITEGTWLVDDLPVTLQDTTAIVGQPFVGAQVRVRGHLPGSRQLLATDINVESTEVPWPTETPEPTTTPKWTETPLATDTPAVAETPILTETPEPTDRADTAEQSDLTRTPRPSAEVEPAREPEPTDTAEPAEGVEPTNEPRPAGEPELTSLSKLAGDSESTDTESADKPEPTEKPGTSAEPESTKTPEEREEPEPTKVEPSSTKMPDATEEPESTAGPEHTPEPDPSETEDHGSADGTEPAEDSGSEEPPEHNQDADPDEDLGPSEEPDPTQVADD